MSVFTKEEIEYLRSQALSRLATVGPDGQPHVIPVTFWFNEHEDTIDIGGINFGAGKKWRDARQNPKVTFLLDDTFGSGKDRQARALEVRGEVELHETGGGEINPRFPNFGPAVLPDPPEAHRELGSGRRGDRRRPLAERPNGVLMRRVGCSLRQPSQGGGDD
ncbi:MAG: PPOX class F420-dependent oxidoreductase [Actinomycetota bacterium]